MTDQLTVPEANALTRQAAFISSVQSANVAHAEFIGSTDRTKRAMLEQINAAREVGIHLLALKADSKHGEWLGLFATACGKANANPVLHFDAQTGRNYMRIATRFPEPVTDLPSAVSSMKELMVNAGELEQSSRGEQSPSEVGPFSKAERQLDAFWTIIKKEVEKEDVAAWPVDRCEHILRDTERIAEFRERLKCRIATAL